MKIRESIKTSLYLCKVVVVPFTAALLFSACQGGSGEDSLTSISYKDGTNTNTGKTNGTDTENMQTDDTVQEGKNEACLEEVYSDGAKLNACVACHVDGAIASTTDLIFKSSNPSYNYTALKSFLAVDNENAQVLVNKISNTSSLSHFGGKFSVNDVAYFQNFVDAFENQDSCTLGTDTNTDTGSNTDTDTTDVDSSVVQLPGRIEAEKYNSFKDSTSGNEGEAFRNDDVDIQVSGEGGFNVGWTTAGEWLTYNINVKETSNYTFSARVATKTTNVKSFSIEIDGENVTGTMSFPSTNNWQNYIDLVSKQVQISKGEHSIKVNFITTGINLNYIDLVKEDTSSTDFTKVASHIFESNHSSKKCIATSGFPNELVYSDCADTTKQTWEEDTIGRFHSTENTDYCLTASKFENYGVLSTSLCEDKNLEQRWVYKDSLIYNGAFSVDLDVKNNKLIVYTTHGGSNQMWTEYMGSGGSNTGNTDANTDNTTDTGNTDTNTDNTTDTGNTDTNTDNTTDTGNTDTGATDANSGNNEACMEKIFEEKAEISQCVVCHTSGGPAGSSTLIFGDDKYKSLKNYLDSSTVNGDYILDKITKDSGISHIGGKHSASVIGFFTEFMQAHQNQGSCQLGMNNETVDTACEESPAPRHLRMLTAKEYKNSIKDLTGYSVDISDYPLKIKVDGFDTISETDALSSTDIDYFMRKAESTAAYMINNNIVINSCNDNSCAKGMISSFGRKVYRRDITYTEKEELYKIYTHISTKNDFKKSKALMLKAMFTSPYFLYRFELGEAQGDGTYKLKPYEVASALSFQFLGTTPDYTLLNAARDGKLKTQEELLAQARRLMQDSRAKDQVANFAQLWLGTGAILESNKNSSAFTNAVRTSMYEEVDTFIKHVVFDDSIPNKFDELYNADYAMVNGTLAQHYGLSGSIDSNFVKVSGKGTRGGILGLGALQSVQAHANESSPIKRGVFVRENLLCQDLPQPPSDQEVTPPGLDPSLTTRERFAAHTDNEDCKTCHVFIDDVGFGFERYDELGRYREKENGNLFVSDIGKLVGAERLDAKTSHNFNGALELATIVSNTHAAQECFATQYFRFSKGYIERSDDSCSIDKMYEQFEKSNFDLKELFIQSVTLKSFTIKK